MDRCNEYHQKLDKNRHTIRISVVLSVSCSWLRAKQNGRPVPPHHIGWLGKEYVFTIPSLHM